MTDIPSKYKITGVDDTHPIKFGNDGYPNEPILTVTKDGEYEVDWYNYGKNPCIMAGFIGDCNITIEQVAQYPNGLLLDGVEDYAVNTVIPAVTDFTVIGKRNIFKHLNGFAIKVAIQLVQRLLFWNMILINFIILVELIP